VDQLEDISLVNAVRSGDLDAFGQLYRRHRPMALRVAAKCTRQSADAADCVSEAFAGLLRALLAGKGPDRDVRPYVAASVRNAASAMTRRDARQLPTDDLDLLDASMPVPVDPIGDAESEALRHVWSALPRRWCAVLWATEVDRRKPADIARELGMSPNAVSALAKRARHGLRHAYGRIELDTALDPADRAAQPARGSVAVAPVLAT
jgi:RNA polymerase sigma factor (sigma-70 family)